MLIDDELNDPAVLRAEDQAIREAETPKTEQPTALDDLARLLNGDPTPVHGEAEG